MRSDYVFHLFCPYLYPLDADERLWDLFYGEGEKVRDGKSDCPIEGNGHEQFAGRHPVSCEHINADGEKDDDLARHKKGRHVQATKVGTLHDLGDFHSVTNEK